MLEIIDLKSGDFSKVKMRTIVTIELAIHGFFIGSLTVAFVFFSVLKNRHDLRISKKPILQATILNLVIMLIKVVEYFAKLIELDLYSQSKNQKLDGYPGDQVETLIRLQSTAIAFKAIQMVLTALVFLNISRPIKASYESKVATKRRSN